jgi:CHAD domain-containing protein
VAFRLRKTEPLDRGLKRVTNDELQAAIELLRQSGARDRARAVHAGRKSIKKTRAVLDLLRRDLGKDYAHTRKQLRRAARRLAIERDAHVMLDTLAGLHTHHHGHVAEAAWTAARSALETTVTRAARQARAPAFTRRTMEDLDGVRVKSDAWRIQGKNLAALRPALRRSLERARDAFDRASGRQDAESLHRWRKRVKAHWYQMRLLEAAHHRHFRAYTQRLHQLESWLGEHQNLVMLRHNLRAARFNPMVTDGIDRLVDIIVDREGRLRRNALTLGQRIYGLRRRTVVDSLDRLWRTRRP